MRILLLFPHFPDPPHGGTALRNYHLAAHLARRHEVTIVTFGDPAQVTASELTARCVRMEVAPPPRRSRLRRVLRLAHPLPDLADRLASPALVAKLAELLRRERIDVLHVGGLEMVPHWRAVASLVRPAGAAVVLDEHNAEYVLQARAFRSALEARRLVGALYSGLQTLKLRRYEALALRAADGVVAVSEADRAALERLAPLPRAAVVPNGVDTEVYRPGVVPTSDEPRIVFTGTMNFRANVEGVEWFCRAVWPLIRARAPGLRFQIVGREPTPTVRALAAQPGVEVIGAVPDDRPWIGGAPVYVVPLLMGGGVRLKILQAMALGVPVVSTTLGYEGIAAVPGEHLLVADDPADFAAAVLRLLDDAALRDRLARSGRELAVTRYDWRHLVPTLETLYERVVAVVAENRDGSPQTAT